MYNRWSIRHSVQPRLEVIPSQTCTSCKIIIIINKIRQGQRRWRECLRGLNQKSSRVWKREKNVTGELGVNLSPWHFPQIAIMKGVTLRIFLIDDTSSVAAINNVIVIMYTINGNVSYSFPWKLTFCCIEIY